MTEFSMTNFSTIKLSAIKLSAVAFLALALIPCAAKADDTPSGVASDVGAVQKDSKAIADHNAALARDRAEKAKDKANGNYGGQAIDSLKVGADKMGKSEKETEKSTDQKILHNDVDDAVSK